MIDKQCFTTNWIENKAKELKYSDTNLIEKVIRAFSLLDMLANSGCPFHFKGGSCLMLLLRDSLHRLSIDIDIMCPPGTDIEQYLSEYKKNDFIDYELIERKQAGKDVPKNHSKFFYQVSFKAGIDKTSFILLDVLYEDCHYINTNQVKIHNDLIKMVGEPPMVNVPSIEDILGDKLTAFAPETTGIPYYKGDKLSTLEIIKQLFDIGRLFDNVNNLDIVSKAFTNIAKVELGYRDLPRENVSVINEDIRTTALNISTRGFVDKEKFALLQQGVKSIRPFMYKQKYNIEDAITDASKAAYLSTLIEMGYSEVKHYDNNPLSVTDFSVGKVLSTKLNKLKMSNPEAFYYWALTDELLSMKKDL